MSASLALGALLVAATCQPHRHRGVRLAPIATLFLTSDRCIACHAGVTSPAGEDLSIGYQWRASMMAQLGARPVLAGGRASGSAGSPRADGGHRGRVRHLHMPMARTATTADVSGASSTHLGGAEDTEEAVLRWTACRARFAINSAAGWGRARASGRLRRNARPPQGERHAFSAPSRPTTGGSTSCTPRPASGRPRARTCGSRSFAPPATRCSHRRPGMPLGRLPEQMPYLEWRASAFQGRRTCESCHMPPVPDEVR